MHYNNGCVFFKHCNTNFSWDLGESGGEGELGLEVSSGVGSLALLLLGSASCCKVKVEGTVGTGIFEAGREKKSANSYSKKRNKRTCLSL